MTRATKRGKDGKPVITEKQFMAQIKKVALLTGWKFYHTYDSRRSDPGFPDCVMVHPQKHRMIILELKTEKGLLTPAQREWVYAFDRLEERLFPVFRFRLLRPSDFDWIVEELKR